MGLGWGDRGFAVHVVVAVAAGSLINRLPDRLVGAATALLFAVGAMLLWRESGVPVAELDRGDQTAGATPARLRTVVVTSFVTVGLAEWGDLTQLATASLAADRGDSYGVGIGAFVALATVAGLAAFVGRSILRVVSLQTVRRLAAGLFGALAIWTLFELF